LFELAAVYRIWAAPVRPIASVLRAGKHVEKYRTIILRNDVSNKKDT
jgi:hypothetical protein